MSENISDGISSLGEAVSRPRRSHVTDKQRNIMLSFMEEHPAFQRGELVGARGREKQFQLKEALTNKLNACGDGVSKDSTKWMKSWQDWKCGVKSKARELLKHQQGTGGGSPMKPLSSLDERCLEVITMEAVSGDIQLREGGARKLPPAHPTKTPSAALGKAPAALPIPIVVIDNNGKNENDEYQFYFDDTINLPDVMVEDALPEAIDTNTEIPGSKIPIEERGKQKKQIKNMQPEAIKPTELVKKYIDAEDARLAIEQERLKIERETMLLRKEELEIKKEELILKRRNTTAIEHASEKLALLANEMMTYYRNKQ